MIGGWNEKKTKDYFSKNTNNLSEKEELKKEKHTYVHIRYIGAKSFIRAGLILKRNLFTA